MLPVVALIKAKAGKEKELEAMLRSLVAPTRAEAGCVQYDLHVDKAQPGLYVFVERWESESHLKTHLKSSHIQSGMARRAELIETLDIRRLQPLA
jgi:quinol monooxygenase YgiN